MEKKRRREGFRTQPTLASLLVAYMLRYALVGAVNSGKVADQHNSSNVGSSTNSDQGKIQWSNCVQIGLHFIHLLTQHLKFLFCNMCNYNFVNNIYTVSALGVWINATINKDSWYVDM